MAISLKTAGTWAELTNDGAVTIPGSPAAGDRMFLFATWKDFSITASVSGWTAIGAEFTDGAVATGNGAGSMKVQAWYRDWVTGDGNPTIDFSGALLAQAVIMLWTKAATDSWNDPSTVTAAWPVTASTQTISASSTTTVPHNSVVMALIGIRDDSATFTRPTTAIDVSAGITWNGNYAESPATHASTTTGNDMAADLGHRFVTTGATAQTLRVTATISAVETGAIKWVIQGLGGQGFGQAQAQIKTFGVNSFAQAQGTLKVTTNKFGQANAKIVIGQLPPTTWSLVASLGPARFGNSIWVAAGSSGTIWTATTPVGTWTQRTSPFSSNIYDIEYGADGYWVAIGDTSVIAYATDPTGTWTTVASHPAIGTLQAVAYGNSQWRAIGDASGTGDNSIKVVGNPSGSWVSNGRVSASFIQAFDVEYGNGNWVYGVDAATVFIEGTGGIDLSGIMGTSDPISSVNYSSDLNLWVVGSDGPHVLYATNPAGPWTDDIKPTSGQVYANSGHHSGFGGFWLFVDEASIGVYKATMGAGSWSQVTIGPIGSLINSVDRDSTYWVVTLDRGLYVSPAVAASPTGYGQAQADIKQTYNAFAQSQADIKHTYNSFAQAQADIKQTYTGVGQAQAFIGTYRNFAQAGAYITGFHVLTDTFTRTVSNGWGTPDIGGDWSVEGALDPTAFSVNGTKGIITVTPVGPTNTYLAILNEQTDLYNLEEIVEFSINTLPPSTYIWILLGGRDYFNAFAEIDIYPDGSTVLYVGVNSGYATIDPYGLTILANTIYQMKLKIITMNGLDFIHSKVWEKGQPEPEWSSITVVPNPFFAQTGGPVGVQVGSSGNATPTTFTFDNYNAQQAILGGFAQVQAQIKKTYIGVAQAQASIKRTYNGFAQAQASVKANQFAQAQANIKQTYTLFAQAQADIKQTYQAYAQAQADILVTYFAFAQAQASIKQTYNSFAQVQANIRATYQGYAQAQASIKTVYNAFSQAQGDIKAVGYGFAQSQSDIKQIYQGYANTQAYIKITNTSYAQTQADIKQTYNGYAQAQSEIKQTYNGFGQSQSDIKQTYQGYAQAQATILGYAFGQSQADIKVTTNGFAQTQAKINAFNVNTFGQAQTVIRVGNFGFGQAQAKINTTRQYAQAQALIVKKYGFGQAQARIKQVYQGYGQTQADIKATSRGFAQAQGTVLVIVNRFAQGQARILQIYSSFAQAQADIKQVYQGYGQAQAIILGRVYAQAQAQITKTYQNSAQAQAYIIAKYTTYAQAQGDIKQTYQVYANTQGTIRTLYRSYAQSQALITTSRNSLAQSQAYIRRTEQGLGQAQGTILATYKPVGQSQADIRATANSFAQTQTLIKQTYQGYANAQAIIRAISSNSAQAQGYIVTTNVRCAQSQAHILVTDIEALSQAQAYIITETIVSGQAQAYILAGMGHGSARAFIRISHYLKKLLLSDRESMHLVLADRESPNLMPEDTLVIGLILSDRDYEGV